MCIRDRCTGNTDFAETVKVQYDPDEVDLPFLIDLYFKTIEPTSLHKQGGDRGCLLYTSTCIGTAGKVIVFPASERWYGSRHAETVQVTCDVESGQMCIRDSIYQDLF